MCYAVVAALLRPSNGKEVKLMDGWFAFLVSVAASVVGYYICKWLDRHDKGK